MKEIKKVSTTIKLENDLYDEFKILCIRHKTNLQKFVEKCVHLYHLNDDFKRIVNDFNIPLLSPNSDNPNTKSVS